jgi:uncharacterized protein (DUF1778 family)
MRNKTTALFIRCSEQEAERIRNVAKAERRTISGFVLNAVLNRIEMREKMQAPLAIPIHKIGAAM